MSSGYHEITPAWLTGSTRHALGFNNSFFYTLKIVIFDFFCLLPLETIKYLKKKQLVKILFPLITTQVNISLNTYDNPAGWSPARD